MSSVMKKINTAVMDGGQGLKDFANVSGMSASEFKKAWEKDPYKALTLFEKGIKGVIDSGGNATQTLKDLKISESRQQDTVLRLAGGYKQLDDANRIANEGWQESNALSREAEQKYKTLGSKIQIFKNHLFALGKSIGEALAPALIKVMDVLTPFIKALTTAPDSVKILVVSLMAIPVVVAPIMFALAGITGILASAGTAVETFAEMSKGGGKSLTLFGKATKFAISPLQTMKNVVKGFSFKGLLDKFKDVTKIFSVFGKNGAIATRILPAIANGIRLVGSAIRLALFSNPITGTITLIIGALVLAYAKVDWFREGVNNLGKFLWQLGKAIGKDLIPVFKAFGDMLKWVGDKVVKLGKFLTDGLFDLFAKSDVGKQIKKTFKPMADFFTDMQKPKKVRVFDGISEGTEKALKEYVKFSEGTVKAFEHIKYNGGKITKETQKELSDNIVKAGEVAVKELEKKNKEMKERLEKNFSNLDGIGLSSEVKKKIRKKVNEEGKERLKELTILNKKIQDKQDDIYNDGKLTSKEKQDLEKMLQERNELVVKSLSQSQKEQRAILDRMKYNVSGIKVSEASSAIRDNAKAEAEALKEAKKRRDKALISAGDLKASGGISEKQYKDMIARIEKQYDGQVSSVKKKSKELKDAIEKHNPKISTKIDMETGEEYSAGQQAWNEYKRGVSERFERDKQTFSDMGKSISDAWKSAGDWYNNANKSMQDLADGFNNGLNEKIEWFKHAGHVIWDMIKNGWNDAISGAGDLWNGLTSKLSSTWGTVQSWFVTKGGQIWSGIKSGWNTALSTGGNLWNNLTEKLGATWNNIRTWFVTKGKDVWNSVKSGFTSALNSGKSLWSTLTEKLSSTFGTIRTWFITKGKDMANGLKSGWNNVVSVTTSFFSGIWKAMQTGWQNVYNFTVNTYRNVKNYLYSTWKYIYDKAKYWLDLTLSKVKGIWNGVYSKTTQTYSLVKSYIQSAWKYVYDKISYWLNLAISKIRNIFDSIYRKITSVMATVKSYIQNAWKYVYERIRYYIDLAYNKVKSGFQNIYNKATSLAKSTKNFVVDRFKDMYTGAKKWIDSIGDWLVKVKNGMATKASNLGKSVANGAISGLNGMIKGINKISHAITDKNLLSEIKPLSTGTRRARNLSNTKGQLRKDTTALVNDKGQGNGKGPNGHQEIILRKDGSMYAPKGKNVVLNLEKGDSVVSGAETQLWQQQGVIPTFSTGSFEKLMSNKGKSKKKKKPNALETLSAVTGGFKALASHTAHNVKAKADEKVEMVKTAVKEGGAKLKAGASYVGGKIGDVWEYMSNPGKLVSIALDKVRGMFSGGNATMEMARLSFDKLKKSFKDKVQSMFDEFGGGDGSGDGGYLFNYPIWQRFGKYTGGLGFNGGNHYGVDFGMPIGTPVSAVKSGVVDRVWNDYGGGNSVQVKTGPSEWNWYMHLSKQLAKVGQKVNVGSAIGKSGDTGHFVRGAHLHFQVMKGSPGNGTAIDAIPWLKALQMSGGGGGKGGISKSASAWRGEIARASKIMGAGANGSDIATIIRLIQAESGGNSGVVQHGYVDVNTGGNEARGLLQYTPTTFSAFKMRGHGNILSGMDQLLTFFNNTNWRNDLYSWSRRYSSGSTGWGPTGRAKRYANGGIIRKHSLYEGAEGNKPEMVIPLTRKARAMELIAEAKRYMGISETESSKTYNVTHNTNNTSSSNEYLITVIELMQQQNAMLMQLVQSNNTIADKELLIHEGSFQKQVNKAVDKKNFKEKRRDKYRN